MQLKSIVHREVPNETPEEAHLRAIRGEQDILDAIEGLLVTAWEQHGPPSELTPEDLVTVRQIPAADGRSRPGLRADYELHHAEARLNLSALVAAPELTLGNMHHAVYMAYALEWTTITERFPADWRLVAATVRIQTSEQRFTKRDLVTDASAAGLEAIKRLTEHGEPLNKTEVKTKPARFIYIDLVFAEVSQSELEDPNSRMNAKENSQLAGYLATRILRSMPSSMRQNRRMACRVLAEHHGVPEEIVLDPEGNVVQDEPKPAKGGKSEPPPMVQGDLDDERLDMAQVLLDAGQAPGKVASLLGVHHATLRKALRDREAAAVDDDADVVVDDDVVDDDDLGLGDL